jgi:phage terminase small subunit
MRLDENGLNDRQRHFAEMIVSGLVAKRRLSRDVKAEVTAEVESWKLLKNPKVSAYIQKLRAEDNSKLAMDRIISKQELLEFLTQVIRTPAGAIDKQNPPLPVLQGHRGHQRDQASRQSESSGAHLQTHGLGRAG